MVDERRTKRRRVANNTHKPSKQVSKQTNKQTNDQMNMLYASQLKARQARGRKSKLQVEFHGHELCAFWMVCVFLSVCCCCCCRKYIYKVSTFGHLVLLEKERGRVFESKIMYNVVSFKPHFWNIYNYIGGTKDDLRSTLGGCCCCCHFYATKWRKNKASKERFA